MRKKFRRLFYKYLRYKVLPSFPFELFKDILIPIKALRLTVKDLLEQRRILSEKRKMQDLLDDFPNSKYLSPIFLREKHLKFGYADPSKKNIRRADLKRLRALKRLGDALEPSSKFPYMNFLVGSYFLLKHFFFKRWFKGRFSTYFSKMLYNHFVQTPITFFWSIVYSRFVEFWNWFIFRVVVRTLGNIFFINPFLDFLGNSIRVLFKYIFRALRVILKFIFFLVFSPIFVYIYRYYIAKYFVKYFRISLRVLPYGLFVRIFILLDLIAYTPYFCIKKAFFKFLHFVVVKCIAKVLGFFLALVVNTFLKVLLKFFTIDQIKTKVEEVKYKLFLKVRYIPATLALFPILYRQHVQIQRFRTRTGRYTRVRHFNPIRRMSNAINNFKYYIFWGYQDFVSYIATQILFSIPYNINRFLTPLRRFEVFHRLLWRNFFGNYGSGSINHLKPRQAKYFTSSYSYHNDTTLTDYFSNQVPFPRYRYFSYELKDYYTFFADAVTYQGYVKDLVMHIRAARTLVIARVSLLLNISEKLIDLGQRLSPIFIFILNVLFKIRSYSVALINLIVTLIFFCIQFPILFVRFLILQVSNFKFTFYINVVRFDKFKIFSLLYFFSSLLIGGLMLLEFFYFFGGQILSAQNLLMRVLDPFLYNHVIFLFAVFMMLSLFSTYIADIWLEIRLFLLCFNTSVYVWATHYMILGGPKPSFVPGGGFIRDQYAQNPFWFNENFKVFLLNIYVLWHPHLRFAKTIAQNPYEGGQYDLRDMTFEFVTSLF